MKNHIITLSMCAVVLLPNYVNAAAIPHGSRADNRIQSVSYNAANTTVIKSKVGFLTTIVFDEGEAVLSTRAGFAEGWSIDKEDNVVYISPRPVIQQQESEGDQKNKTDFSADS